MLSSPASASALEELLSAIKESIAHPAEGIFGPDSVSWKINRESIVFLAGGRAALLQLAHPWVAAAVAQHSKTLNAPVARFHRTFRVIFAMVFGSAEQAFAAARGLHRLHETIRGAVPEGAGRFVAGSPYQANDLDALRWVYATLVDSALKAYELILPALNEAERERYFQESKTMAALFGIAREQLPQDWKAFCDYMQEMLRSETLAVSDTGRRLAHQLQNGAGSIVRLPRWYRALTIGGLPPRLREQFQLELSERDRRAEQRALRWIRRVYRRLPLAIRFVGPYNEALSRLRGGSRPSLAVRISNRLWVGQPMLLSKSKRSA